jgi:hypothetical protein
MDVPGDFSGWAKVSIDFIDFDSPHDFSRGCILDSDSSLDKISVNLSFDTIALLASLLASCLCSLESSAFTIRLSTDRRCGTERKEGKVSKVLIIVNVSFSICELLYDYSVTVNRGFMSDIETGEETAVCEKMFSANNCSACEQAIF